MENKKLTILYGSQTGTAQDIAEKLWQEGKCYDFYGPVLAMDDYDIQNLIKESYVVFICSTTGQGDEPDNMKNFWKFLLRKNLPSNSLQNLKYAVLGLGDSSYIKYNFCAKKLYKRLLQLGAEPLVEPGYADDQHDLGIDAVVYPWISGFWIKMSQFSSGIKQEFKLHLFPPRWLITIANDKIHPTDENLKLIDLKQNNSAQVSCIGNDRVTSRTHFQDTRLIKFTSENLHYTSGDVLMIRPRNSIKTVQQFFDIFSERKNEIKEDVIIRVIEKYPDMPVPFALQKPVKLRTIVEQYWDLNMVPRRSTFELLSHFTDSELEREKLIEFTSTAGQEELYNYCNRPRRTILEVLVDFPYATANIPLNYFFELFQPIRPRAFSIASSFKNISVIMIGPGTGIAPFRSYVHEIFCKSDSKKLHVVFGCRNKNADFYFKEEWLNLQKKEKIQLYTAFSRDQSYKIYVQHIIKNNGRIMHDLITKENAYIFVAGNSKNMPDAVREAFISVYSTFHETDLNESEKVFRKMELDGRYQTETWS
ncbi:hypothetical protein PGB90_005687 [Kerria lacca]